MQYLRVAHEIIRTLYGNLFFYEHIVHVLQKIFNTDNEMILLYKIYLEIQYL